MSPAQIYQHNYDNLNDFVGLRRPYWIYANAVLQSNRYPFQYIFNAYKPRFRAQMYLSGTNTEGDMVILMSL